MLLLRHGKKEKHKLLLIYRYIHILYKITSGMVEKEDEP